MAKAVEKLVLFTVSTCGLGSDDLGTDSKEICLLAWQVIDCSKIQVSINNTRPDNIYNYVHVSFYCGFMYDNTSM